MDSSYNRTQTGTLQTSVLNIISFEGNEHLAAKNVGYKFRVRKVV